MEFHMANEFVPNRNQGRKAQNNVKERTALNGSLQNEMLIYSCHTGVMPHCTNTLLYRLCFFFHFNT